MKAAQALIDDNEYLVFSKEAHLTPPAPGGQPGQAEAVPLLLAHERGQQTPRTRPGARALHYAAAAGHVGAVGGSDC